MRMGLVLVVMATCASAFAAPPRPKRREPTVKQLIQALKSLDPATRGRAVSRLWRLGPAGKDAAPAVLEYIRSESGRPEFNVHEDYGGIEFAGDVLAGMGPEVIPVLIVALGDLDDFVRGQAIRALVDLGPSALPALVAVLREKDELGLRHVSAAGAIARMEDVDPEAVLNLLIEALKNAKGKEAGVRMGLTTTLGHFGPNAQAAVPVLVESLSDPDQDVQSSAAKALGQIGVKDQEVVLALGGTLAKGREPAQRAAALVLRSMGADALPALDALIGALDSPHIHTVPQLAVEAIGSIGPQAKVALPAVLRLIERADASGQTQLAAAARRTLNLLEP